MKKNIIKSVNKIIVLAGMAFTLPLLTGCVKEATFNAENGEEKTFNTFDFSTENSATPLEVAYLNTGVKARVYFELYDEMPVVETTYIYKKRPDVLPLFAAYTDKDGLFKENVKLPAYLKKVYIYAPAFYARTLIEAEVVNGAIQATDATVQAVGTRTVTETPDAHDSYMVTANPPQEYNDKRWMTWLGEYDKNKNGEIKYKYTGDELAIKDVSRLYEEHNKVIGNSHSTVCPEEYRRYTDLRIDKDAELAVTFLGQNTCWNCSLGYYYYEEGHAPKSLDEANIIMLFPNTQDGNWDQGQKPNNPNRYAPNSAGIDRGTVAQLKFYPNNDQTKETTVFPAGYRIGFVLANNAWSNRLGEFNHHKGYRAATSEGLSVDNNGTPYNKPRTAAYKYESYVMISFEDHVDDENFSDVVITMTSNPVEAITDIPVVDPKENKVKLLRGVYAFEDLWPSEGDFDMNDVIVRSNYEKTFVKENNNAIQSESFIFKTFHNIAALTNGLAVRVTPSGQVTNRKYFIRKAGEEEFSEANFTMEKDNGSDVYLLTEDVRKEPGTEYKVTLEYAKPVTTESEALPFIFRPSDKNPGKRWEAHLPMTQPTSKMDYEYFGLGNDASNPDKGIYYVRNSLFPFAIFLSGATEKDVAKLLDPANESKNIEKSYPEYVNWAKSAGSVNADWYKK